MKPIQLTMTAFGPYKNREVIDFTRLKENRLFVISGKTGAGKTTIFDGICFALYGSASGEDRQDFKMLRSDFADDDIHTSVELVFEIHGKTYRIMRQLGHVKKGNKTATGEKYEFYEIRNSGEVPCVDRQMVSEINHRVEEIIGLTKDQFSQIVMLPQGEFRKLLTSKTENKEEILRKIFQTYPYQEITERLKEKRKDTESGFERLKQWRDQYISEIYSKLPEREDSRLFEVLQQEHQNMNQILDGLSQEAKYYELNAKKIFEDKEKTTKNLQYMQDQLQQAKSINEKFSELEKHENRLKELNEQAQTYDKLQNLLEKSERASRIEVYESQLKTQQQEIEKKRLAKANAERDLESAIETLKKAESEYQLEENRKPERDQLHKQLEVLKDLRPKVNELEEIVNKYEKIKDELNEIDQSYQSLQSKLKQKEMDKDQLDSQIRKDTEAVQELPDKEKRLYKLENQLNQMKQYQELIDEQSKLEKHKERIYDIYIQVKEEFENKEQAWIHGQAGILAAHLKDGDPCPVCGSTTHPNKAALENDTPSKDSLDEAKLKFDHQYQELTQVVAQLESKAKQVQEKKRMLVEDAQISLVDLNQTFDLTKEKYNGLQEEVQTLYQLSNRLKSNRETFEGLTNAVKDLSQQVEALRHQYDEQKLVFERAKLTYENLMKDIIEDVRTSEALERKIEETKLKKQKLEADWEGAQTQLQLTREKKITAEANVQNCEQSLQEQQNNLEEAEELFNQKLEEAGFFNQDDYRLARKTEEEQEQMKRDLEKYRQSLATVQARIQELAVELTHKEKMDIAVFEVKLEEAQKKYEAALQAYNNNLQIQKDLAEIISKIKRIGNEIDEQEKKLNRVADLFDVIRGQNARKISFERYLQIEYLDQIVSMANARLKRLSNGQFYLKRSDRQESRGRQSGLSLDVYDVYTGQDRDVKTLSGGEKFNAALSLALGMSDVIQSYKGGVSIETMFIDEGFGSLDEESLNKAIDTLIDLQQSGRMIGVISHVGDLKSSIPAVLEVDKSRDGHSQTKFMLK